MNPKCKGVYCLTTEKLFGTRLQGTEGTSSDRGKRYLGLENVFTADKHLGFPNGYHTDKHLL